MSNAVIHNSPDTPWWIIGIVIILVIGISAAVYAQRERPLSRKKNGKHRGERKK